MNRAYTYSLMFKLPGFASELFSESFTCCQALQIRQALLAPACYYLGRLRLALPSTFANPLGVDPENPIDA
jgi:hypothetical protein